MSVCPSVLVTAGTVMFQVAGELVIQLTPVGKDKTALELPGGTVIEHAQ